MAAFSSVAPTPPHADRHGTVRRTGSLRGFVSSLLIPSCVIATWAGASAAFAQAAAGAPEGGDRDAPFVLHEFRLPRTEAVSEAELMRVVAGYLRREIGPGQLSSMVANIRRVYDDHGLGLASVGITVRDPASGSIEIHVLEPRIGRIQVEAGSRPPIAQARALGVLDRVGLRTGALLNLNRLDRAMFTLNDWPGVSARATLAPSGDEAVFNVVVVIEPRPAFDGSVDFDNHGAQSSGRYRLGGLLRWNNPSGIGDNVDVRALVSNAKRVTLGRLAYEAPLGATPWRAGAGYSRVTYSLGEAFQALGATGSADVLDVSLSYPIIRGHQHNLTGRLAAETKRLEDRFDAVELKTNKRLHDVQANLAFEARDGVLGGGFTGGALSLTAGRLVIASADDRAADAALGERATQGGFGKVGVQLTRLQSVTPSVSAFAGIALQWASKNLDNSEKLTLGGAKGVRAYPGGEAPVDEGFVVNTELRAWINQHWTAFTFYDVARGALHARPGPGAADKRTLRGAGLGVQFARPNVFHLKATLGWRGSEPALSESSDQRQRLLVQLQKPF